MSNSSRKHKKKEESMEYHFSDSVGKVINLEIPAEKVSLLFQSLSERLGENNETINEYSIYKNQNLELTVFPDGSSFCRQVILKKVDNKKVPDNVFINYKEKHKISNDIFPSRYSYNSVVDIIDVIFDIDDGIKIILSTIYENNKSNEKIKNVESLGNPRVFNKSKNVWCEVYISTEVKIDYERVVDTINYVKEIIDN